MTGTETAFMIPSIMAGSLMRATPPAARMSAGTRSSAMTATAPASSAIFACSGVTTSMMTPPLSIWASPFLVAQVEVSTVMWDGFLWCCARFAGRAWPRGPRPFESAEPLARPDYRTGFGRSRFGLPFTRSSCVDVVDISQLIPSDAAFNVDHSDHPAGLRHVGHQSVDSVDTTYRRGSTFTNCPSSRPFVVAALAADGSDDPRHEFRGSACGRRRQPRKRLDQIEDVIVGQAGEKVEQPQDRGVRDAAEQVE